MSYHINKVKNVKLQHVYKEEIKMADSINHENSQGRCFFKKTAMSANINIGPYEFSK